MSSDYQLHSWFTYSMLLLFLSTAGFWVILFSMVIVLHGLGNVVGIFIFHDYCLTFEPYLLFINDIQMARLNEGLALFDAILIVPMFQIAWTFFSICTGFIYFQEYQVILYLLLQLICDSANELALAWID